MSSDLLVPVLGMDSRVCFPSRQNWHTIGSVIRFGMCSKLIICIVYWLEWPRRLCHRRVSCSEGGAVFWGHPIEADFDWELSVLYSGADDCVFSVPRNGAVVSKFSVLCNSVIVGGFFVLLNRAIGFSEWVNTLEAKFVSLLSLYNLDFPSQ